MFKQLKKMFSKSNKPAKRHPKVLQYEELEPRVLFSADVMPGLDNIEFEEQVVVQDIAGNFQVEREAAPETAAQTAAQERLELVIVNEDVADYKQLVADLQGSDDNRVIEVVVLESDRDGIEQVSEILAERSNVAAVHVITHGSEGQINLGNSRLTGTTLTENSDAVAGWGKALTESGDILFYGCKIAADSDGQSLLNDIAKLTGAEVAASDDLTGNSEQGGDWELEYQTGAIEAQVAMSKQVLDNYRAVLESESTSEAAYLSTPLTFEQNNGQNDDQVDFVARGSGYTVFLTEGDAVLMLQEGDAGHVLRLDLVGGDTSAPASGADVLASQSNYLIGNDESSWQTDVANYGAVEYSNVYDGIDLRYYGNQRQLEYDFIVSAGADTSQIRLNFEGVQSAGIGENGDLILTLNAQGDQISFKAPVSYQLAEDGSREAVQSSYVLHEDGSIGFELGAYDAGRILIIDPVLNYATYLGGLGTEYANGITVDGNGDIFVVGQTYAANFPATFGSYAGGSDAYVAKLTPNASGATDLVFATYIGGTGSDFANGGIHVDGAGNIIFAGTTESGDFATTAGAYDTQLDGSSDAYIVKLDPTGTTLLYSTLFGGTKGPDGSGGREAVGGMAVDAAGNVYITGQTLSDDLPLQGAYDSSLSSKSDIYVAKFALGGNGAADLLYSTYLGGGTDYESSRTIAVDSTGKIYIAGSTGSADHPTTTGAYQETHALGESSDAYLSILDPTLGASGLVYSTFLGGTGLEGIEDIYVDPATGIVYAVGYTSSTSASLAATIGAYATENAGDDDAFVAVLNPVGAGTADLQYLTYFGGTGKDRGEAITVDSNGRIYVSGYGAAGLPQLNPVQAGFGGGTRDAFIAGFNPAGAGADDLEFSSYLGGADTEYTNDITTDGDDNIYIAGQTQSNDFPTTTGAYDESYNGDGSDSDAFVAKFILNQTPTATDNSYSVGEGGTLVGNVITDDTGADVDSDPDADSLTASVVEEPLHGTLVLNADGSFTYTPYDDPTSNFADSDSFTYQVSDGKGGTDTATVTITVTPDGTNEAPVNSVPGAQTVNQDTSLVFSDANGNRILLRDDAGGNAIEVTLTATNGTVTLAGTTGLTVTGDGSDTVIAQGSLTDLNNALDGLVFTPTAGYFGSASLQVATNDLGQSGAGVPESDTDTISITVNETNYSPVITSNGGGATAAISLPENSIEVTTVTATDSNPLDTLTYSISGTDSGLFTIDGSTGVLNFNDFPDFENPVDNNGDNDYQVTVSVSDGRGGSDSQDLTITITKHTDDGVGVFSNTTATPRFSYWTGTSFVIAGDTDTLNAPYRIMQGADAPTRDEKIVVGVDAAGVVTGEISNGSGWNIFSLGNLGEVSEDYWYGVDVAYEQQSGDAVVVWNDNTQAKL